MKQNENIQQRAVHLPACPPVAMLGNAEAKHGPWGTTVSDDILRVHIESSCDARVRCHKRRYDGIN
jgi:hypothetical protein